MPLGSARYRARRLREGEYVDGIYQDAKHRDFDLAASIQPVGGNELLDLEEGLRKRQPIYVYTKARLNTVVTSKMPDQVRYEGEWYEIHEDQTHNRHAPIPHSRYLAVRAKL